MMFDIRRQPGLGVAVRPASCLYGLAILGTLGCAAGLLAGCGGGGVAPVQSPSEPTIQVPTNVHVVGKGETVYAIAWRHGVDYRALARHNEIGDPYTIYPGQRLLIPGPDDALPPEPATAAAASSKPETQGDVSTRGTGTEAEPRVKALPPPSSGSATSAPAAQPSEESSGASGERPQPAPASEAPSSTAEQGTTPVATRTESGLRWTWPTEGKTIGAFAGAGGKGLDIAGAYGQPIRAAARGRVVYAGGGLIGYGNLIILKHNRRLLSAYAHNDKLHVNEGDTVKGGHHIADMGRSSKGRTLLHFEIRRDGKPVDPRGYLP